MYQIDAFAEKPFEGNPAAVVPLVEWLQDAQMQAIAAENNLAETAFFIEEAGGFHIRWFTPTIEVNLCGHATLACAYVLYTELGFRGERVKFQSLSGELSVSRSGDAYTLDFPAQTLQECSPPEFVAKSFDVAPSSCYSSMDYLLVFDSEDTVRSLEPNLIELEKSDLRGVIVAAPGKEEELVIRYFAPGSGIPEDPVTGSAFTQVMPYWTQLSGQNTLKAKQVSERSGKVRCELTGDRVLITGQAVKYLEGDIYI